MVFMTDELNGTTGDTGETSCFVGLDVGSTAAKIAVPDDSEPSGYRTAIRKAHHWKELLEEIPDDMNNSCRIVSTGYFRRTVPHDRAVTEITAAIHGVRHFFPGADLIIDIGGQDVKVIETRTSDFRLNDKCSAGTGAFLELVARYFDVQLEELSEYHERAQRSAPINQTCGVFAVSEMISRMVEGYTMEEVVAGVHHAFARRISHLVGKDAGEIVAIGGVSGNGGVISALSEVLGKDVKVPDEPQIVNAVGAARYGISSK